ncbi:hypothetical protein [Pleomorphomonas koreensis]|uniref:hypothetical protein n=1 Tax=Pleomorphomonas koreensis TaxID=257440 RepID=UPI00047CBC81|nr:hypothetical protein [Pleomorphomonas koreensis]
MAKHPDDKLEKKIIRLFGDDQPIVNARHTMKYIDGMLLDDLHRILNAMDIICEVTEIHSLKAPLRGIIDAVASTEPWTQAGLDARDAAQSLANEICARARAYCDQKLKSREC